MSDDKRSFVHRLFARKPGDRWVGRWPEISFERWDGGAGLDQGDDVRLKQIAATAGGAALRRVLRCGKEDVVIEALNNPGLKPDDVAHLVASPKSGAGVLAAIARRKEWSGDPQIALALCLNSKTPYFASRFLLGHLQGAALREVVSSAAAPPQLVAEARQLLEKKATRRQGK